jgi:phosphotransferase system HPr (HPr) family protein
MSAGVEMPLARLKITNETGLHARPAAVFVQEAGRFQARIEIRNATTQSPWVDAKSILSLLTIGVEHGHEIDLNIQGEDEQHALDALGHLIRTDFAGKL